VGERQDTLLGALAPGALLGVPTQERLPIDGRLAGVSRSSDRRAGDETSRIPRRAPHIPSPSWVSTDPTTPSQYGH
jgi:hypothetical protein